jgi:hypothetical protein
MSHLVSIATKVRDPGAVAAACQRLKLAAPFVGSADLFSGEAKGLIVQLPNWQYPIVIDTANGSIQFDNYGGQWGEQAQLDHFLQAYAVERAKSEARRKGFVCREESLENGSIKLQIIEGN